MEGFHKEMLREFVFHLFFMLCKNFIIILYFRLYHIFEKGNKYIRIYVLNSLVFSSMFWIVFFFLFYIEFEANIRCVFEMVEKIGSVVLNATYKIISILHLMIFIMKN